MKIIARGCGLRCVLTRNVLSHKKVKPKLVTNVCANDFAGGSQSAETKWLEQEIQKFLVVVAGKKKPSIKYRLPLIGGCCREAWVIGAGFPNPRNSRIQGIEAKLRKNGGRLPKRTTKQKVYRWNTHTNFARAFLTEYALMHSQRSPSCGTL